jgi:penicillin amidase
MGGRIPIRGDGSRLPPTLPVPGWSGEWDWHGYLDDASHPAVLNPASGFVVTANNRQVAGALGDRISSEWEAPFRAARIRQLLSGARDLTAEAVHAMQLDVRDAHAERYRDRAVEAALAGGFTREADALRQWDLQASAASHPAALYYAWYSRLRAELAGTLYGDTAGYLPRRIADAVLDARALPWLSPAQRRPAFDTASMAAFRVGAAFVGGRSWGQLHGLLIGHALGGVAALRRLLGLNLEVEAAAGSETTVNVRHPDRRGLPTTTVYGASQRHVVDLADVDGSGGFIITTGQSGLPFDRHYRDQFDRWLRGGLWLLPLARERAAARSVHQLHLVPE